MTVSGRLVGVCEGVENSSGGSVGAGVRLGWGLGVGVAASWVLFSLAPGVNIASSGGKSAYLISACRTVRRQDSLSCTKGMFEARIAKTTRSRDAKKNHNQRGMRPLFRACSGFNLNMERLYPNQCPLLISCPSHGGINGLGETKPLHSEEEGVIREWSQSAGSWDDLVAFRTHGNHRNRQTDTFLDCGHICLRFLGKVFPGACFPKHSFPTRQAVVNGFEGG